MPPRRTILLAASVTAAVSIALAQSTPHTYRNPILHLALQYPSTLDPEDFANTDGYSYRTRFALHPDSDPESKGADPCSPILLAVGMGPDQPLDEKKAKSGKKVPLQPTGGLTLNEIKHSCLVHDNPANSDQQSLSDLVENSRHIDGLKPIPRVLTFQVQGATVYFAASSGNTADDRGKRSGAAGQTFTGAAAVLAPGERIAYFTFTANSLSVFNSMLASKLCLDAPACSSGYATLVPYALTPDGLIKPTP